MKRNLFKSWKLLIFTLTLLFVGFPNFAQQVLAFNQKAKTSTLQNHEKSILLKDALISLKEHYKVDIVFGDKTIETIKIASNEINYQNSLEQNLNGILQSSGLKYKKLKNGSIAILSSKSKRIIGDIRSIDQTKSLPENIKNESKFTSQLQNTSVEYIVKGKVIDENGEGIPGVSIILQGTSRGTSTNNEGLYSLSVNGPKSVLVFSFVGYFSEKVIVGNRKELNISLLTDAKALDEVVVVGYGEVKKSDLTGAVTSVKVDEKMASQNVSMDKLLQGRAAGVDVISGNGAPGAAINVRIRGVGTLTGNSEPLYVVDGIIMNSGGEVRQASTNGNYSQETQNGLTALNPQDIETIEILKDASATAIYGSRGANGVVLVTTKRGKSGKTAVNFRASTEISRVSKQIKVLDGQEYAMMDNEFALINKILPRYPTSATGLDSLKTIDWFDYSFRDAITQNYRLSFSGKVQNTSFYLAGGFSDFQGTIKNSGLKKGDLRLNFIHDVSPKLKITSNTSMMFQVNNWTQGTERLGQANSSMVRSIMRKSPLIGLETTSEDLQDVFLATESPQTWFEQFEDRSKEFRVLSALNFDYKLSKIFAYRLVLGMDYRNKSRSQYFGNGLFMGAATNGRATYSNLDYISSEVQNLLLITPKLGKKHNLSGTVGFTFDKNLSTQNATVSENFFTSSLGIDGFSLGQAYYPLTLGKTQISVLSALARSVYSFNNRYFLTMTGRVDGSSKFAPGNKFGFFPSFAFAWKVSNESFFKSVKSISDLKLRLGWGRTGVQTIGAYQTRSLYNANTYPNATGSLAIGQIPARIANEELTWETSSQYNLGLDAGFLKNRLKLNVDIYNKTSIDLLQNFPIAPSNGFGSIALNLGSIQNRGIDIMLDGVVIEKPVRVSIGGNISINRNKLLNLGLPLTTWGAEKLSAYTGIGISTSNLQTPANIFAEGQPVGMFWGLKTAGIVQSTDVNTPTYKSAKLVPGDVKMIDQNGDGLINDLDKTFIGNPNPTCTYGFNSSVSYKNLKLDVFFSGVYGRDIVNANWLYEGYLPNSGSNIRRETYLEAWRADKESNAFPRLGYQIPTDLTDRFIEDGSYLRLSNVNISYMIPFKKKKLFSSLEVFASGRNLALFTKYNGFDPDVNSYTFNGSLIGVDFNSYPNTKAIQIGFSANF